MPSLAKVTRPRSHRVAARPSLFAWLDDARTRPLVWIFGPPGAGKSTLVASYLAERRIRSAWFHVDAGDADPGTFFHYLAAAVPAKKNAPALPPLAPEQRADLGGFARLFFRQLFECLDVLVIDNLHEVADDSALTEVLDQAVGEVPVGGAIVVISRSAPGARFLHYELAERIAMLDGAALRMSLEETRAIADRRALCDDATLRRIHEACGGWAAGITLALQRSARPAPGVGRDDYHLEELFDGFALQVIDALPNDERSFLEITSLLPTMTAESADALTERADAARMLESLYRRGLFTERRASTPKVYRYHDLFRAFLQRRHAESASREIIAERQRRAGRLLEESGQADAAVRLYIGAQEWRSAVVALRRIAGVLLAQGRDASLREWLRALPPEIVEADPWLAFWAGMADLRHRPPVARVALERAWRRFSASGEDVPRALACGAVVLGYMYEFTDVRPLDPWIEELRTLLAAGARPEAPGAALIVERALLFALSFRQPIRAEIDACVGRVLDLLTREVGDDDAAMACAVLLLHLYGVGDVSRAARIARRLQDLLAGGAVSPLTRALATIQLGHFHHSRGDLEAAEASFRDVLAFAATHALALPVVHLYAHLGLAFRALEAGDLEAATAHQVEVASHWRPERRMDEFASTRVELWIACRRGRWSAAHALAERQVACADATGVFWMRFESRIQLALVASELGKFDESAQLLGFVDALLEGTGYEHFRYQVDLGHAWAALLRGDVATCRARLRTGLPASRADEGKVVLRMHPALLARLCDAALAGGVEPDVAGEMVRALQLHPPDGACREWPWPLRVYTLGRFEILRDSRPLEYSRKAPKKSLALLKALIAFGGQGVREQRLVDTLWGDEEGDAATRALGAALHRLRALLGDPEAVQQLGGVLSLDRARVWVDVWAFDALLSDAEPTPPDALLDLYRGAFLREEEGEPWAVTMRERLRGRFIHAVGAAGRRLEDAGADDAAIACYLRGLDADPVIEPFYQGLMRCYARLERRSEALSAYQRMKRLLSISLGVSPSAQSERLYQTLRLGA